MGTVTFTVRGDVLEEKLEEWLQVSWYIIIKACGCGFLNSCLCVHTVCKGDCACINGSTEVGVAFDGICSLSYTVSDYNNNYSIYVVWLVCTVELHYSKPLNCGHLAIAAKIKLRYGLIQ